jgi:hypothetical protein
MKWKIDLCGIQGSRYAPGGYFGVVKSLSFVRLIKELEMNNDQMDTVDRDSFDR